MQEYSSKNTCQNFGKRNAAYKYLPPWTKFVFDYGCGKYDNNKIYCEDLGIEWVGYDKYWKDDNTILQYVEENKERLDCIICSNVLNVINDDETIYNIIEYLKSLAQKNTILIFSCYSGNKSNIGCETKKDCWQRNEKPNIWKKRLSEHFEVMYVISDIFVCKLK